MTRTLADARRWMADGLALLTAQVERLTEEEHAAPTLLPGWTRKHLIAHVAANADAIGNLVQWAATGERTPMYSFAEQRNADIEAGAQRTGAELTAWLNSSGAALEKAMADLTDEQWTAEVLTAQGRTVPASETPWMRSREVYVHAVDLGTGLTFADLPDGFLTALIADIRAKRGLDELPEGEPAEVAAWLAGRPHSLTDAPQLGPWL